MTDTPKPTTTRPAAQSHDEAVKQAKHDALSPDEKHKNYLADLERLHKESVVDSLGHTPRAG